MNSKKTKSFLACLLVVALVLPIISGLALAAIDNGGKPGAGVSFEKMDVTIKTEKLNTIGTDETEEVTSEEPAENEVVRMVVELEDNPVLDASGVMNSTKDLTSKGTDLSKSLAAKQEVILNKLSRELFDGETINVHYNFTLIFNGFSFDAPYGMLEKLRNFPGVKNADVVTYFSIPTPQMFSAGGMVGAPIAWDLGYNGAGTVVSVIDTGLDMDHPAFAVAPPTETLKYTKDKIAAILAENDLRAEQAMPSLNADKAFLSEKVPFVFDYHNNDADVNHNGGSPHGSHVAGIVLANPEDKFIQGVAPEAQLVVQKVFPDSEGGAPWDAISAALEDCVYLKVDSANMSLGSPCGFSTMGDPEYEAIWNRLNPAGVNLSVAAGNDYNSGYGNSWGLNSNITKNPDNGTVGSPSTYAGAISVASIDNANTIDNYIQVNENKIMYGDKAAEAEPPQPEKALAKALGGQTLEMVAVPGLGAPEDYAGLDCTGKVALVVRGNLSFEEKQINAYNAGAVAIIIYNNQPGMIYMQIVNYLIPAVSITQTSGQIILDALAAGTKTMYIGVTPEMIPFPNGCEPSDFSNWGSMSNLRITPDIAAPGGNILSAVEGGKYEAMSGTSMAAPNNAGNMAVVVEYVDDAFPDLSPLDRLTMVNRLLMSTANPVVDAAGVPYSVRKVGAGLVNCADAITTRAYLTTKGCDRPKIELGDDPSRSGVYTLNFSVTNFGTETLSYLIDPILTTNDYKLVDQGTRSTNVMLATNKLLNDYMTYTTNYDGDKVAVAAGETKDITVTITVKDNFREMAAEVYPNGAYVEGYVYLHQDKTKEGDLGTMLNIPYLGFYGSWNEPSMIDTGFYYNDPAEDLSGMTKPNTAGCKKGTAIYGMAMNPYFEEGVEFLADRGTLSPANEDKIYDKLDALYTGLMRNAKSFYYKVTDEKTGDILRENNYQYVNKNYADAQTQTLKPYGLAGRPMAAWNGSKQEEGQTVIIRAGATLDYEKWDESLCSMAYWDVPVTLDNTPPSVVSMNLEGNTLTAVFTDNHYLAYVGFFADAEGKEPLMSYPVAETTRGAQTTISFDTQGKSEFYVLLGDYGCNEAQFMIKNGTAVTPAPPTPTTDKVFYAPVSEFEEGETYLITVKDEFVNNDGSVYALSNESAKPYDVRLVGDPMTVTDGFIMYEQSSALEWQFANTGAIKNVENGHFLGLVESGSYWLGLNGTPEVQWTFDGTYLQHNSSLTTATHLIYYKTIENSEIAAFDVFNPTEAASKVQLYKKVVPDKPAPQAFMTLGVEEKTEGDKHQLLVNINITENSMGQSGVFTLNYNPNLITFDSSEKGALLEDSLAAVNGTVPGKILCSFAGQAAMTGGGLMLAYTFNINAGVESGTRISLGLVCNELVADDTTTLIPVEAKGLDYYLGGSTPTPTPPTSPTPTQPPAPTPSATVDPNAVVLTTEIKEGEGDDVNKLFVTISMSADSQVQSGMLTVTYDNQYITFDRHKKGELLADALVVLNSTKPGTIIVPFAGSSAITDGGEMITFTMLKTDACVNGTKIVIGLVANELLAVDTTTLIPCVAYGAEYIIGQGTVTPTPPTTPTQVPPTPTQVPPTPTQVPPTPTQVPPTPTPKPDLKVNIAVTTVGGTVSPLGEMTIPYNGSVEITLMPDTGYRVYQVKVNGEVVTEYPTTATFKLENITVDVNVEVSFIALDQPTPTQAPATPVPSPTHGPTPPGTGSTPVLLVALFTIAIGAIGVCVYLYRKEEA
ncbi:MAG: S8 family serine peptidase [Clostridia bacterium]